MGWTPRNPIEGAEYLNGSWYRAGEEVAGLVCFAEGRRGQLLDVTTDDLRIAACWNVRLIGDVVPLDD